MKKSKKTRALAIGASIIALALLLPVGWSGLRALWGKNQTPSHTGEISFEEESRSPLQNSSGESSEESSISPEEQEYLDWIQNKPDQDNVTVLLFGLDLDGLHTDVMTVSYTHLKGLDPYSISRYNKRLEIDMVSVSLRRTRR